MGSTWECTSSGLLLRLLSLHFSSFGPSGGASPGCCCLFSFYTPHSKRATWLQTCLGAVSSSRVCLKAARLRKADGLDLHPKLSPPV